LRHALLAVHDATDEGRRGSIFERGSTEGRPGETASSPNASRSAHGHRLIALDFPVASRLNCRRESAVAPRFGPFRVESREGRPLRESSSTFSASRLAP
jgi:hypothetical protein